MDSQQCVLALRLLYILMICFVFDKSQAVSTVRGFPRKYIDHVRVHGVQPQPIRRQTRAKAFFAPDDNLQKIIIDLINKEHKKIQLAMYLFTDPDIAQALIDAHNNGIMIEVITDQECLEVQGSVLTHLGKQGIALYVYPSLMHDKFVVFAKNKAGKPLVWTGSYNFTRSGGELNQENAVLIDDATVVKKYKDQFTLLKESSSRIGGHMIKQPKRKSKSKKVAKKKKKRVAKKTAKKPKK